MLSLIAICVCTESSNIDVLVQRYGCSWKAAKAFSPTFLCYLTCLCSLSVLVDTAASHICAKGIEEKVLHNIEPLKTAFILGQFSKKLISLIQLVTESADVLREDIAVNFSNPLIATSLVYASAYVSAF